MKLSFKYLIILIFPLCFSAQEVNNIFGDKSELYFSFDVKNKTELDVISQFISIDHRSTKEKIYAYANKSEFSDFLKFEINYQLISEPTYKPNNSTRSTWDYYPSYPEYASIMQSFADSFPSICKLHNLGTLSSGHEILAIQISDNIGIDENEPSFLYTSSMHGNELTGYVLMLRLIDELLKGYGTNNQFTYLVNEVDIWVNPLANPDGAYITGDNSVSGATRYNANGVDLNRNYPDIIDGPNPDGNSWQEETMIFIDLADSVSFNLSCNLHTGAEVFNYPWDRWSNLAADDDWWQHVSAQYADSAHLNSSSGYFNDLNNGITNGWDWYQINGGRQDFMNYFKFCREATLELSSTKTPSGSLLPYYWNANATSLINYIEQSTYGLRGIVTDSITGIPLKAKVEIIGFDVDSSHIYSDLPVGNYHRYLYQGTYQVTFSKLGYNAKTIDVIINNDTPTYLDVQLSNQNNSVGIEFQENPKTIVNSSDILGRSASDQKNIIIINNYSDGSTEKKIIIE
jgi:hypothetical protein